MYTVRLLISLVVLGCIGLPPLEVSAQSLWVDPALGAGLEVTATRVTPIPGQQILSGAARFALAVPLGPRSRLEVELPAARIALGEAHGGTSETRIGAPYIGVAGSGAGGQTHFQVGVRVAPWDSDQGTATFLGVMADPERFESFGANMIAPRASVQFGRRTPGGLVTQGRIGGTALFGIGDFSGDPELLVDYGARIGSSTDRRFFYADLSGRLLATESGSLADRTVHYLGLSGGLVRAGVAPIAELRIPLSESQTDVIFRIGARLSW